MFKIHLNKIIKFSIIIIALRIILFYLTVNINPYFNVLFLLCSFLLIYYFIFSGIKKLIGKLTIKISLTYVISILVITSIIFLFFNLIIPNNLLSSCIINRTIRFEIIFLINSFIVGIIVWLWIKKKRHYLFYLIFIILLGINIYVFSVIHLLGTENLRIRDENKQFDFKRSEIKIEKNDSIRFGIKIEKSDNDTIITK